MNIAILAQYLRYTQFIFVLLLNRILQKLSGW